MEEKAEIIKRCISTIRDDRVLGVQNDLKAFLYIRQKGLEHSTPDNIGGGNIVVALSLFSILSFLGKAYYCTIHPHKFDADGKALNETETFVHFMRFLQSNGINLGLPDDPEVLRVVWKGFRDYLAHRLTVEPGKSVVTFTFEPGHNISIDAIIETAKEHPVFQGDRDNRNWKVNGDSLYAFLPEIIDVTARHLESTEDIDTDLLLKVIGIEYP